jgi:hypothetical protein
MPTSAVASRTSQIQLLGMTGLGLRRWLPGGDGVWRGGMDNPQALGTGLLILKTETTRALPF